VGIKNERIAKLYMADSRLIQKLMPNVKGQISNEVQITKLKI